MRDAVSHDKRPELRALINCETQTTLPNTECGQDGFTTSSNG